MSRIDKDSPSLPPRDLEFLWEQYSARLLAFIRRRVTEEADAEDLLQDIYLRAHQRLCCLEQLTCPTCWMYRVARNAIVDYYRTRREHAELPEGLAASEEPAAEKVEAELALSLKEMVAQLPGIYREAVELTEYQGLSQKKMATRLGLSLPGAKSRVQRARRLLRDMLLACCHLELSRRGEILAYHERCCHCQSTN